MTQTLAPPFVSVVIPARNAARTIGAQLEALANQEFDGPWEVVVADNGSTDATVDVVMSYQSRLPGLRVTSAGHGAGINLARNAGIRAARGSTILLCDADDVVRPGWIAAHVLALQQYDLTGGALDEASLNTTAVARFNAQGEQHGCPVSGRFLRYAVGGNCAFRRDVWDSLGGFDDAWQRGATEIEFCWRAQLGSFTIGWVPEAVVAYRHGPTIGSEVRRRYRSARAVPRLYAAFRDRGMPGARVRPALRAWAWLLYRAPWAMADGAWRIKWLQVAAWRAGLAVGSLRYRVAYL